MLNRDSLKTGAQVRAACRRSELTEQTAGLAAGFAQANLAILPLELAYDFQLFCQRNPKPCPVLDVTEVGSPVACSVAPDGDLRTDVPKYRVWEHGRLVSEPSDIRDYWRDDFVSFVIGCSFIIDLPELGGRKRLEALDVKVLALCEFEGH